VKQAIFIVPGTYFLSTRLNNTRAVVYHGYSEYLLGILIMWWSSQSIGEAIINFVSGYAAFIAVYELGYMANDLLASQEEESPRQRLTIQPSRCWIALWSISRLFVFATFSYIIASDNFTRWAVFYMLLVVTFALHNGLRNIDFKILTFIGLALCRFYAPLVGQVASETLARCLPGILIHYVFFRTLTYMDSKGLLVLRERRSVNFKLGYSAFAIPSSVVICVLLQDYTTLVLNVYFLILWVAVAALSRVRRSTVTSGIN
jgi:hypothetical protein